MMKMKEFKNLEVINVRLTVYSLERDKYVESLHMAGINVITIEKDIFIKFKASVKQLLLLKEVIDFQIEDAEFRIDCQN